MINKIKDILLVPDVIAGGHNIRTARIEFIQGLACIPLSAGRVFTVDNINAVLYTQTRGNRTKGTSSRTTDNVTDQHNAHDISSHLSHRL